LLKIAFNSDAEIHGTLCMDRDRVAGVTRLVPATIAVTSSFLPDRNRVESFIRDVYRRTYGAAITSHYPTLMNVHDAAGNVMAAIGLRRANEAPLFVESYLSQAVEDHLTAATGAPVERREIVEVGNLASAGRGASIFLFVTLAAYLRQRNVAYAVMTATKSLRRTFALFGFDFMELADADPDRLPDNGYSWGSYYRNDPKVIFGAVEPALARLEPYLPVAANADMNRLFSVPPQAVQ
jgi:hypothetical protein